MSANTFGHLFRFTSFGESHGPAIGCVVDGVPPRIPLAEGDIQVFLDRRRPGQSRFTSQRREPDTVQILSGVFEGLTTGAPVGLLIANEDTRPKDYDAIKNKFRPGHADFTYWRKYGIRDHRGGGRSSARETAMRVAAGAVARKVLGQDVTIRGALVQMGPHAVVRDRFLQQMLVKFHADVADMTGLFLAQQIAGAADIQIMAGQSKAGAKGIERLHDLKPFLRRRRQFLAWWQRQISVGAGLGPADAATNLV